MQPVDAVYDNGYEIAGFAPRGAVGRSVTTWHPPPLSGGLDTTHNGLRLRHTLPRMPDASLYPRAPSRRCAICSTAGGAIESVTCLV